MGVVGLLGADDALAGRELPGHPQRFKVGQGAAGGEVAQKLRPAEHAGDLGHRLDLHLRAGAAAVAGVVVGIDLHGQRIGGARHRMRRLEHLPGIERMEVGIVVAQAARSFRQHPRHCLRIRGAVRGGLEGGQGGKLRFKQLGGAGEQAGDGIVGHGDLSPYHTQR